jgi:hypothetical protein
MVMKAAPQTMLQIQPRRKRNAVTNCRRATQVLAQITFCFVIVLNLIALPQRTVKPLTNVPEII